MLIEILDMIMTRVHENRDRIARYDCLIVPKAKKTLDEAVKESCGYSVLWDGRETYVVKGMGTSCSMNLQSMTCSCRVWDLLGIPCVHGVTAIQEVRHNVFDYVEKCYTKETYIRCYSYCLDVIRGEDFWEDVEGDLILPPLIVKQLRGHSRDKCPDKQMYPVQPKNTRGRPKKKQPESDPVEEVTEEVHLQQQEILTGKDDLMNETLAHMEGSEVVDESIPLEEEVVLDNIMKFMSAPSLRKHTGIGCTTPVSTPPTRK
ncbi:hypothetical protein POM88_029933 [Heracleum sosnowskyi]|uniref:SWIM-type domain-containing protein n=1 Tax=Heracleum sosnowskyi TaxID=360622 RepID=A0AAD8MFA4_9APIA|nr:hypothetical protein POM88_029933 [Heracleum sosnowskyi]